MTHVSTVLPACVYAREHTCLCSTCIMHASMTCAIAGCCGHAVLGPGQHSGVPRAIEELEGVCGRLQSGAQDQLQPLQGSRHCCMPAPDDDATYASACECTCVRACVRACVRMCACERACECTCERACVRAWAPVVWRLGGVVTPRILSRLAAVAASARSRTRAHTNVNGLHARLESIQVCTCEMCV